MYIRKELLERIEKKKKLLDSLRPFPQAALQRLKERFHILFAYNSNAIEGNSLTLSETKMVIQDGVTIGGKTLREHNEAINHGKAMDFIENILSKKIAIDENTLCQFHSFILDNIIDEEKGRYRKRNVWIEGASFLPPKADLVPEKMKEFFLWFNKNPEHLELVEQAILVHEKFVFIHPFIDGNGRIARLLTSFLLMQNGFPPLLVLKIERQKYIRTLDQAHQENYPPFVNFMARCLERSLDMYLDALQSAEKTNEYISLQEATKYCQYSQEYLSLLARKGVLESVKFGRNWMTTKKAVDKYAKDN